MSPDASTLTQERMDESIKYLFPSGLGLEHKERSSLLDCSEISECSTMVKHILKP